MMEHFDTLVIALPFFFFSLLSARLDKDFISAPMFFTALGLLVSPAVLEILHFQPGHGFLYLIAELTLVLILFADAAHIRPQRWGDLYSLPSRLLFIGLPLMIIFGGLGGWLLFPSWPIWTLLLLAAICAPTDAALGQAVVSDPRVPARIRNTLNVESGLNDGLVLPVILVLIALAGSMGGMMEADAPGAAFSFTQWLAFGAQQVILGPLAGIIAGLAGAWMIRHAYGRGLVQKEFAPIAILMIAPIAYGLAGFIGGNGFLAAFCGGLAFGHALQRDQQGRSPVSDHLYDFTESEGRLLSLLTFFLFGAVFAPELLIHVGWREVVYGLLSLTLIRMAASALALIGAGLRWQSILFIGWFGPRGLASVLFALLVLEESGFAGADAVSATVTVVVLLSILLHGVSAGAGATWYARFAASRLTPHCPENQLPSQGKS